MATTSRIEDLTLYSQPAHRSPNLLAPHNFLVARAYSDGNQLRPLSSALCHDPHQLASFCWGVQTKEMHTVDPQDNDKDVRYRRTLIEYRKAEVQQALRVCSSEFLAAFTAALQEKRSARAVQLGEFHKWPGRFIRLRKALHLVKQPLHHLDL